MIIFNEKTTALELEHFQWIDIIHMNSVSDDYEREQVDYPLRRFDFTVEWCSATEIVCRLS